jgi:hypothetical protein
MRAKKRVGLAVLLLLAGLWPGDSARTEPLADSSEAVRIERLIHQLGAADFAEREAASAALEQVGAKALPALRQAATGRDLEVRRRAAWLVEKISGGVRAAAEAKVRATVKRLGGEVDEYRLKGQAGRFLRVRLVDTGATDADLAHFRDCQTIGDLFLDGTRVTDAGLACLEGLKDLRDLGLRRTRVSDAGLIHLRGLTALESLQLDDTKVTDAGLVHLHGLTRLIHLSLSGTKVEGPGLAHLKELDSLGFLMLANTQVTDPGLVHLEQLTHVHYLDLSSPKITDTGIVHLPPDLLRLDVSGIKLRATVQAVRKHYPHLQVLKVNDNTWEKDDGGR